MPAKAHVLDDSFWAQYFRVYDALNFLIPYQELCQEFIKIAKPNQNDTILDAGSGTGNLCILLKKNGADVIGLDYSQVGISMHIKKDSTAKTIHADLTKPLPFKSGFFSKIVSNNTLYTLEPRIHSHVIQEFYRILQPGGILIISNLKAGWSPYKIYSNHISKSIIHKGFLKTAADIIQFLPHTILIFYYNRKIKRSGQSKAYHFFKANEQKILLEHEGFQSVEECAVYANQALLTTGHKPL